MWVLKRRGDGLYVGKIAGHSFTKQLRFAEKFENKEEAVKNSCPENEYPVQINPYDYFTGGG